LVDKGPEELQAEGILPKGTVEDWTSSLEEPVLVGRVANEEAYEEFIQQRLYRLAVGQLPRNWQDAKYIALYVKKEIARDNGVFVYGKVNRMMPERDQVLFEIDVWENLAQPIKPVNYGVANAFMTTLEHLKAATELPELFMKSAEEKSVWKLLRRVSDQVKLGLDHEDVDKAKQINEYQFAGMVISMDHVQKVIVIKAEDKEEVVPFDALNRNPSGVFRKLVGMMGALKISRKTRTEM